MSNKPQGTVGLNSHELLRATTALPMRPVLRKRAASGFASVVLICLGLVPAAQAQVSTLCDPVQDAVYGSGKGGPRVPAWFDIAQSSIVDSSSSIVFTLTLSAPIPVTPVWENAQDGGQFWWGYRIVGDIANLEFVSNGCIFSKGNSVPAAYFLDLIWDVETASFRARLLDDTSCTQSEVPFSFSADRSQVILIVSKALFTNTTLVPDPNTFDYFSTITVWRNKSTSNMSLQHLDDAPDQTGNGFVVGTWASSGNSNYPCQ